MHYTANSIKKYFKTRNYAITLLFLIILITHCQKESYIDSLFIGELSILLPKWKKKMRQLPR